MAGSDTKSVHRPGSGFALLGRARITGLSYIGTATAGYLNIFDTLTAPVAATYTRSGTTVTVTSTGHGLKTGDIVGIAFRTGTGGEASSGNYPITVTSANAFTLTELNSGTISGTVVCSYVNGKGGWVFSTQVSAGDTYANIFSIPGEGLLVRQGIYVEMTNVTSANIFYS